MRRHVAIALLGACVGVGVFAQPLHAQEQEWSVTMSSATGRYFFDQPTVSHVLTVGGGVSGSGWRLGALWPIVVQNSTAVTFIGGAPLPTGGPGGGTLGDRVGGERVPMRRRQTTLLASAVAGDASPAAVTAVSPDSAPLEPGPYVTTIGDPILSAGRDILATAGSPHRLSTTLYLKLPVANVESGVGSGAVDAGFSLSYGLAARQTFLFVDVGYWYIGDLESQPLRDIGTGAVGIGRLLGWDGGWTVATVLSAASSVVETVKPPMAISVTAGRSDRGRGALTAGATAGLSESSADWTVQLGWRLSTGRATP